MKEEIFDVVRPISQGSSVKASLYVLVPLAVREKLKIDDQTQFIVILAANGDIIYRRKEA